MVASDLRANLTKSVRSVLREQSLARAKRMYLNYIMLIPPVVGLIIFSLCADLWRSDRL